jgi:hypothetical protein
LEGKPRIHPVNKSVKYNQKHDKTEYGKGFEIALDNEVANIPECVDIYFFYKVKRSHNFLIWIHLKTMVNLKFSSSVPMNDMESR